MPSMSHMHFGLQALGAEVVATAGTPAKRSLLRGLGVADVISSRSLEFTSELAGLGSFDVVLNSLTSPGMQEITFTLPWLPAPH